MELTRDSIQSVTLEKALTRAVQYLEKCDDDYKHLIMERNKIMDEYHNMLNFLEYEKPKQLSDDEHKAMIHYLELESRIEDMKHYAIYLCGHLDCSTYLQMLNNFAIASEHVLDNEL